MIIVRTPFRLSLCGGGTDFPIWFKEHGGLVVGGAISKYSHLFIRRLPHFHGYKSRFVYSKIETVTTNDEVEHAAIRETIAFLGMQDEPLEILHAADLPAKSGTGSSSTFIVGLLNGLLALQGKRWSPTDLANAAIDIEQTKLGETVGCQDQSFAAHGGLNVIRFRKNGDINVNPMALSEQAIDTLEEHLMLFFMGARQGTTSSEVASSYVPKLLEKGREQWALMRLAEQAIEAIYNCDMARLGELIDQSWRLKASLSDKVCNVELSQAYAKARIYGAYGGKITGAGGGGCMVLVAPPDKHHDIEQCLRDYVRVPFKFDGDGSTVMFSR